MSASWSSIKSFTKAKSFSRPFRAERRLLGKSFNICTIDAECCAIVVVQSYGGAMFVIQTILWCSMGVVYGVYLTIPIQICMYRTDRKEVRIRSVIALRPVGDSFKLRTRNNDIQ